MSSHASVTSDPLIVFRWVDVLLVVLAVPLALLAGVPALGVALGAGGWIAARAAESAVEKRASKMEDFRWAMGAGFAGILLRVWFLGLCIIVAGKAGSDDDGLAAAILIAIAFTIHLGGGFAARSLDRSTPAS